MGGGTNGYEGSLDPEEVGVEARGKDIEFRYVALAFPST